MEIAQNINKEKNTPLMDQYFSIKQQHADALVFFQVGDFYELFFEDAKIASNFLAIALTKRGKNKGEDIPLCGVPIHALNHYLTKLVRGGFKVAICDQLSKPQPGTVVQRGVRQVLTPGTLTDSLLLDEKSASYLLSFYPGHGQWSMLFSELLTAQLFAVSVPAESFRTVETELSRFFPDEVVLPSGKLGVGMQPYFAQQGYCTSFIDSGTDAYTPVRMDSTMLTTNGNTKFTSNAVRPDPARPELVEGVEGFTERGYQRTSVNQWIETQFNSATLGKLQSNESTLNSLQVLYYYLKRNQESALSQFKSIQFYEPEDYLILDASTQKNLELVKNNSDGGRKNSLFFVLDKAKTSMGSRTIKKWILRPLVQKNSILQRQDAISDLCSKIETMQRLEALLESLADLERIIGRIALGRAQFNDYLALKSSLSVTPEIKNLLQMELQAGLVRAIEDKLVDLSTLQQLLDASLGDGSGQGLIQKGFDLELDRLRDLVLNGQQEVLKLEEQEVLRTGISSLKIAYNQISGYYIEVTNPNLSRVPSDFIEIQQLVNRKRFTTSTLKSLEAELFKAQNEIDSVEAAIFESVKKEVVGYLGSLRQMAQALCYLDALFGLAQAAYENGHTRPVFNDKRDIIIQQGKHPVLEQLLGSNFIGNDTILNDEQSVWIVTGPNMGGKSTYLRQVALICVMAQIGAFIPAQSTSLPILDRIFTRIGAGDNLAEGKSTFLVEMEETATICTQATKNSLVILDEVGRGTSTFDGIALAQAIVEHIFVKIQARCLFATHYHELTLLAQIMPGIVNYNLACQKSGHNIIFLHKIVPGAAAGSFGLEVARLADLPVEIIRRAGQILDQEYGDHRSVRMDSTTPQVASLPSAGLRTGTTNELKSPLVLSAHEVRVSKDRPAAPESPYAQLAEYKKLFEEIGALDLENLSPRQAFDFLWALKNKKKGF
jgi:DNA mismatch repair protein MutS